MMSSSGREYVYIVLIKAHTGLGSIARKLTGYDYTHIAVCLDDGLSEFYTYSRRRHYLPMDAGMMCEYRSCYAFGDHSQFTAKVFRLPVSGAEYGEIKGLINQHLGDREYRFNVFSMVTMPLFHGFRIYKAYNCMSFIGLVLEIIGEITLTKPYYKYSIKDFDQLLSDYLYFEGILEKTGKELGGYMDKVGLGEKLATSFGAVSILLGRMISKKPE